MSSNKKNNSNLLFTLMMISLFGNACADYALLWYSIDTLNLNTAIAGNNVSTFYIGQAIGAICLAPFLAVTFDKLPKLFGCYFLDIFYGFILLILGYLFSINHLTPISILVLAALLSAISIVYRSAVGFSLVSSLKDSKNLIPKFVTALTLSNMLGAAVAGSIYQLIGFQGAVIIGIVTFLPIMAYYHTVFNNVSEERTIIKTGYFHDLKESFLFLLKNKTILYIASSLAIFNMSGAFFPALMGIALKKYTSGGSVYFGVLVGAGLLISISLLKILDKYSRKLKLNQIIAISIAPCLIIALISLNIPHYVPFVLLYFFACIGSSLRNVSTGNLRIKIVPKDKIGRVNTLYTIFLYSGQITGSFLIVPFFVTDIKKALIVMCIVMVAAMLFSLLSLDKKNLQDVLDA
ncbi:MAG: MFS transporter [Halobacteriovoraceae bacterium]|nr:MFS transporter [Halobacteriovoraceae bacterium]